MATLTSSSRFREEADDADRRGNIHRAAPRGRRFLTPAREEFALCRRPVLADDDIGEPPSGAIESGGGDAGAVNAKEEGRQQGERESRAAGEMSHADGDDDQSRNHAPDDEGAPKPP